MPVATVVHTATGCTFATPFLYAYKEALKQTLPSRARRWSSEEQTWLVSPQWCAAALVIAQQFFRVHERGTHDHHQQHTGSAQASPPPRGPHAVLHLLPTASLKLVHAAYRLEAMEHHPDHGGDGEVMKEINAAFEALTKHERRRHNS